MHRYLIALLQDGRVLLRDGALPALVTEEPPSGREVLAYVGADYFISPERRLDAELSVHAVAARERIAGDWVPLAEVPGEPAVRAAVAQSVREYDGSAPTPPRRPPWFGRGWPDEMRRWADAALARLGRRRTGPFEVARMWSLSAVFSAPTDRGPVFAKTTSENFHAEPVITRLLADRFPAAVPTVLAVEPDRAWMLLDRLAGTDDDRADGAALAAARALADIQSHSLDHLPSLRAAGCPDRTLTATLDGLERLVRDSVELPELTADEIAAARSAAPRLAGLVREFWSCGLPDTLVHGDAHLGNIAYDGTAVRLFDWTDAAISHPFLDGAHLARSAIAAGDNAAGKDAAGNDAAGSRVAEAFAAAWRARHPRADIDRAARLAPVVDRAFQAISYEQIYRSQEAVARWEMAGVVRRFLLDLPDLPARVGSATP